MSDRSPTATPPDRRAPPAIPGPVDTAVAFWRWLRRMRTALYLLGVLAAATLLATIVPQRPNVPDTVTAWLAGSEGPGEVPAAVLDAVGAFDVFGSGWFLVLLVLLFTSLTSCLVVRYRALYRLAVRGRPPRTRSSDGQPHVARFASATPADRALAVAAQVLRRRRYRVRHDHADVDALVPTRSDAREGVVAAAADRDPGTPGEPVPRQVAAERGHLAREGGSLVFHTAFYLLLLGVVGGQLASFRGQVGVVEGHAFADTPVAYWTTDAGRWWGAEDHPGFVLALDRFTVDWTADGQPVVFRADVTLQHPDGRTEQRSTVVNDPLVVDGMKVHTLDWGYAARVVVHDRDGNVAHDAFITMTATDRGFWRGAVKAPATDPQLGLELQLIPDAPRGDDGELQPTAWPGARAPLLLLNAWQGDLRLDRVQGINDLDTTAMQEVAAAALRPGFEVELPGGDRVAFVELRHWVGFQVSRRPTDPLLLVAAGLLLAGLLPALYAYRRRVWVQAATEGDGTVVTVAGHAFQRPHAFEDEFASVVRTLRDRLADRPAAGGADADTHGHAPQPPREVVRVTGSETAGAVPARRGRDAGRRADR